MGIIGTIRHHKVPYDTVSYHDILLWDCVSIGFTLLSSDYRPSKPSMWSDCGQLEYQEVSNIKEYSVPPHTYMLLNPGAPLWVAHCGVFFP